MSETLSWSMLLAWS